MTQQSFRAEKLALAPNEQSDAGASGPPAEVPVNASAAPTAASAKSAWQGKLLGKFRLLEQLGQGAMGRVFRAQDTQIKRMVALKVLARQAVPGRPTFGVEQFLREARAAAAIEHPNAVQIFEVGEHKGFCFIAMELVEGGNLGDLVKGAGPMEYTTACQLCAEAAEALAVAHRLGITHRDIKPANLMLTRSGRCKLVDFGLASLSDPEDQFRLPRETVGTPYYLAPEVGQSRPATPASDIYSLGASLWYLLTGEPIYRGKSTLDTVRMHIELPVPNLLKLRPELPTSLVTAIEKALAKDPAERFADAEHFAKVLRLQTVPVASNASASGLITAPPAHTPARWLPWAIGGTISVIAAITVAALLSNPGKPAAPTTVPEPAPPAAQSQVPKAAVAPPAPPPAATPAVIQTPAEPPVQRSLGTPPLAPTDRAAFMARLSANDKRPVTVEGTVAAAELSSSGKIFRINFVGATASNSFCIVYFPTVYAAAQKKFGGADGANLQGKRIRVTGPVGAFKDNPQIIVDDVSQIQVLP